MVTGLAERDPRLDLRMAAVSHTRGVRRRGWQVLDGHDTVRASGRCFTEWGMYRARYRAYQQQLTHPAEQETR